MSHGEVRALLGDYMDGTLALARRALVDAHLDECAACSGHLRALRAAVDALRRLDDPEPPSGLADRVLERVAAGEAEPGRLARWLSARTRRPWALVPAVGAAAAAVLAVFLAGPGSEPRLDAARLAAQAEDAQRAVAEEIRRHGGPVGSGALPADAEPPAAAADAPREAFRLLQQHRERAEEERRIWLEALAATRSADELRRLAATVRALERPGASPLAQEIERLAEAATPPAVRAATPPGGKTAPGQP